MYNLDQVWRLFDRKPWAVHIFVTEQCNLDCAYCNEYDNSKPHPSTEDIKLWMRKCRELGTARIGFMGGEPLLHPDIVELVRYAKEIGFYKTSMSSNGFKLTEKLVADLEHAGLDTLQISVDVMKPNASTKKSIKSVGKKLEFLKNSKINMNVHGVLFDETIDEMVEVLDYCLDRDMPTHARLLHDDLINDQARCQSAEVQNLMRMVKNQEILKINGQRIHTDWTILEYEQTMLNGKTLDWTCVAGNKYFNISSTGQFWPCSQLRTEKHIMDVDRDYLLSWEGKKECQDRCGVYCQIDMSIKCNRPIPYLFKEVKRTAKRRLASMKPKRATRMRDFAT